jgi:uncharacterized iron-regulated protein
VTGEYLEFMRRVNAGHNRNKDMVSHLCEAMMLWNSLMARNIAAWLQEHPGTSMVVLAGAGHARRKWGIPERLEGAGEHYQSRVILPELSDITGRILDAKGVIREKGVRDKAMDKAVDKLLAEAKAEKK